MTDAPQLTQIGAGPPLVLIHGLGLDGRCWNEAAQHLARTHTVITYDLPGHGRRSVASPYSIADLAAELLTAIDAHGLARFHLGGLSLGGLVAQAFAGTHPQRIAKLVLIDTTPSYDATWQNTWRERAATARRDGTAALVDGLLGAWFSPAFVTQNSPVIAYTRAAIREMSGEAYALACEALAAARLEQTVAAIRAETLVICGVDDGPQFQTAAAWFAKTIPRTTSARLPGKHAAVLENPAEFARTLDAFLQG